VPLRYPRFLILCACLALGIPAAALAAVTPNGRLQIIHMDVGQGDGTVLITPLGQVVLIDEGVYNNTASPLAQLAALGVNHVDLHFASHYHADHIGVISQIVAAGVVIDAGWDRASSYSSGTYTTYVNTLGAKRHTIAKNQVFTLDAASAHPVTIKCVDLNGAGVSTSDENAKSLMLKVSYGEYDESFGGDLTGTAANGGDIESVIALEMAPVEVYKVHHHGSKYSSNDNWLNAIAPKIGVIQTGNGNPYGHPTPEALTRLHNHGVHTYWNETGGSLGGTLGGATPNPLWDRVANGQIIIQATWQPAGVDTIRGPGFADTFTNSGTALDLTAPVAAMIDPNGGEVWDTGSTHVLHWSATDNVGVDSVDVDYSLHGADGPWLPIQHNLVGVDSVAWTLPIEVSDSALVRVMAFDHALNQGVDPSDGLFQIHDAVVVSVPGSDSPGLALSRPAPNPSFGNVTLWFSLPAPGGARLDILDLAGRRLWTWDGVAGASGRSVTWDGQMLFGGRAREGIYWARLTTPFGTRTAKLLRLR
jgi:beta-lactamase superfamily II metal-dependent hydrolase